MRRFYRFACAVVRPICAILYPTRKRLLQPLPEGAALVCANHSNYIDPVLLALAVGKRHWLHFMAKKELSEVFALGKLLTRLGVFFVDRDSTDTAAVRNSMRLLKSGEKVGIFPEGTRVAAGDSVAAKTGAVRLAMKLGVPIVPVFITRNKPLFRRVDLVVGEAFTVPRDADPHAAAEELMRLIYALEPGKAEQ